MRMKKANIRALMKALQSEPVLPKYDAGRIFRWGRRATDQAVEQGLMPVIPGPKETVPTAWIRRALQIERET
jgi:hypothetical protein